jgi:hypothetical protein
MTLLKGRKIAQPGQPGGKNKVYDATAAITAPETTNQYSLVPSCLKAERVWLPFKTSARPAGGVNKIPHNRQGRPAKYTDPSTWMSYEEAVLQRLRPGYAGIGIVFSQELGMLGSDFDHCIVDGVLDPEVEGWVAELNTYTELSFSGEGLHALRCTTASGTSWLPAGRSPGRRTRSCLRRLPLTPFTVKPLGISRLRQWTQLRMLIHQRREREGEVQEREK